MIHDTMDESRPTRPAHHITSPTAISPCADNGPVGQTRQRSSIVCSMAINAHLIGPSFQRPSICAQCLFSLAISPLLQQQQIRTKVLVKIARNRAKPKMKRTPTKAVQNPAHQGTGTRLKQLKEDLKADYLASIPPEVRASHRLRPRHDMGLDAGEQFPLSSRVVARMDKIKKKVSERIKEVSRFGRGEISALRRRLGNDPREQKLAPISREEAMRRYTERKRAEAGLPPLDSLPRRRDPRSVPESGELIRVKQRLRGDAFGFVSGQGRKRVQDQRSRDGVAGPTAAVASPARRATSIFQRAPDRTKLARSDSASPASTYSPESPSPLSNKYPRRRPTATPTPPPSPPGFITPTFHELSESIRLEKTTSRQRVKQSRAIDHGLFDPDAPPAELASRPSVVRSPFLDRRRATRPKSSAKQLRAEQRKAKFGDPYNHPGEVRSDGKLGTPPVMGLNTMRGGWVGEWGEKLKRETERQERKDSEGDGGQIRQQSEEDVWARLRKNEEMGRTNRIPFLGRTDEERRTPPGGSRSGAASAGELRKPQGSEPQSASGATSPTGAPTSPRRKPVQSELARRATAILSTRSANNLPAPSWASSSSSSSAARKGVPAQTLERTISKGTMRSARRIEGLRRQAQNAGPASVGPLPVERERVRSVQI